jgi:hypothetical protein
MVLPTRTPADPALLVRKIDRDWDERLGAEAERYERMERRSALRRAGVCLVIAAAVVVLGLVGFGYETDTRMGWVYNIKSPGWVTTRIVR